MICFLAAAMTIAYCDLDHNLSKFGRSDADYVGLIDVDWHAKRSGEVAQAEALAAKYGYVSSYTTDHFIYETPDEQHGVAIRFGGDRHRPGCLFVTFDLLL